MSESVWVSKTNVDMTRIRVQIGEINLSKAIEHKAIEQEVQLPASYLALSLSKRLERPQICYESASRKQFNTVGDIAFFPKGVPFLARFQGKGGEQFLVCRLDELQLAQWRDQPHSKWNETKLSASLNLSNSTIRRALRAIADAMMRPGFASTLLIESLLSTAFIEFYAVSTLKPRHSANPLARRLVTSSASA